MSAGPPGSSTRGRPAPTWRGGGATPRYSELSARCRAVSASSAASSSGSTWSAAITVRISGSDRASLSDISSHPLLIVGFHSVQVRHVAPSGERRIVDVAVAVPGVEGRLIGRIECGAALEARGEIRIGEERHPEGDEVGLSLADRRIGGGDIEAAVHDVGPVEYLPQQRRQALGAVGGRIDHMEIADAALADLFDQVGEGLSRI